MGEARLWEAVAVIDEQDGWARSGQPIMEAAQPFCDVFGGFTCMPVFGCWVSPEKKFVMDTATMFRVAIGEGIENWERFKQVALRVAAGMDYVYLVDPAGAVAIEKVPYVEVRHEAAK